MELLLTACRELHPTQYPFSRPSFPFATFFLFASPNSWAFHVLVSLLLPSFDTFAAWQLVVLSFIEWLVRQPLHNPDSFFYFSHSLTRLRSLCFESRPA